MQAEEKIYLQRYMGVKGTDIAWDFIKEAMKSVSATCMIMMQDVMRLDNSCRMNSPGKAAGNWAWRVPGGFQWRSISREAAELRTLAVMYDRYPNASVGGASDAIAVAQAGADPLEEFCKSAPDADECRIYED
jgi:4-alpha-glucanotransferase